MTPFNTTVPVLLIPCLAHGRVGQHNNWTAPPSLKWDGTKCRGWVRVEGVENIRSWLLSTQERAS